MLHSELQLGGRYRLDDRIGAGGMGEVWRAFDEVLGRVVAVKAMLPEVAGSPGFAQRFLVEAKSMASVNHPAVASIHDYGHSDGITFLVMEFIDGQSLSQVLDRHGRLAAAAVMRLIAQAADGLQAVHDRGIVHRDIKPANLLIRSNGSLLITDFGISRTEGGTQLTASGAMLGTPTYLSPEQVLGQPVTARSDVYSLGLVAYECLAGRRPFEGENPFAVALQRIQTAPRTLGGDIPRPVLSVVGGALATDPAHRWPSAAALADAARAAAADAAGGPKAGVDRPLSPVLRQGPPTVGPMPRQGPPTPSPLPGQGPHSLSTVPGQGPPMMGPMPRQGGPSLGTVSQLGPPALDHTTWQGPPSSGTVPQSSPPPQPGPARRTGRRLIIAGLLAAVLAIGATAWMMNRDTPRGDRLVAGADPTQSDSAPSGSASSSTASPSTTSPDALFEQAGLAPCGDVYCPTAPMCWGGLVSNSGVAVTPRPLDCAEPHYWETFAAVAEPPDVLTNSEDVLMERPDVAQICSAELLSSRDSDPSRAELWEREAWLIEVPGTDDRLMHCIGNLNDEETTGAGFTTM